MLDVPQRQTAAAAEAVHDARHVCDLRIRLVRRPREHVEDTGGAGFRARRPRSPDEDGALLLEPLRLEHAPHSLRADHAPRAGAKDAAVDDHVAVERLALQVAADLLGQQLALALLHHRLHLLLNVEVRRTFRFTHRLHLLLAARSTITIVVVDLSAVGGDVPDDVIRRAVVLERLERAPLDLLVSRALRHRGGPQGSDGS